MLIQRIAITATVAAVLAACGSMPVTETGFLSSYEHLAAGAGGVTARAAEVAIDPSRLTVGDIDWKTASRDDVSAEDRAALLTFLRGRLQQMAQALPAPSNGRAALLRASITRVETVSPTVNVASALLLFVPLDRGGAAVEIEAVDPQTGEQLAAMTFARFTPLSDLKARFSRLAPANLALERAVSDFAKLLTASEQRTALSNVADDL